MDKVRTVSNMAAIFQFMLIFLVSSSVAMVNQPRNLVLENAQKRRDVAAAAVTTTITKTVTSISTLTTCASTTGRPSSLSSSTTQSVAPTSTITDENGANQRGSSWEIPGTGVFRNKRTYTFTGNSLPAGLSASDYFVADTQYYSTDYIPFNHRFEPGNVRIAGGMLSLIVPGGQNPVSPTQDDPEGTPIRSGEIVTNECNIQYASVRTNAIFSKEPGTCHGLFYYKKETQETDIEFLTDPESGANNGAGSPIPIWYSNQATVSGREPTHSSLNPPRDPTAGVHEHRIDWTPSWTAYFFDGVEVTRFFTDVPTQPGSWVWNNWANGDPSKLFSAKASLSI
jgi:Glycosyl hydrolases family 16